jgi:hypothetical protein
MYSFTWLGFFLDWRNGYTTDFFFQSLYVDCNSLTPLVNTAFAHKKRERGSMGISFKKKSKGRRKKACQFCKDATQNAYCTNDSFCFVVICSHITTSLNNTMYFEG